jgi:hypothetical protein
MVYDYLRGRKESLRRKIMANVISEEKIRSIVREEIKSALDEFLMKLRLELLPYVSEKEQKEIENLYGEDIMENDEEDIAVTRKLEL